MRILLVNKYFYRKGGAETYFFALSEGLRALGHDVAFFSMQHPNNESSYSYNSIIFHQKNAQYITNQS